MPQKKAPAAQQIEPTYGVEMLDVGTLKPHPRNYRQHPDDQLAHLRYSLETHGVYRNVVIARDGTILAGHGVVQAAKKQGIRALPCFRMDVDPEDEQALKILIGDNEIVRLAMADDRALTEMLRELHHLDNLHGLEGTGFDATMLAGLVMVTRPAHEIQDKNEAAEWVGMPEYEPIEDTLKIVVSFRSLDDRRTFAEQAGLDIPTDDRTTISTWWPPKEREDLASLHFQG